MKNLTFAVEDDVLAKARVIAAERKMTFNAMVRDFLREVTGRDERTAKARRELLEPAAASKGRMRPGATFSRDETYER